MEKVSDLAGKLLPLIVIVAGGLVLWQPAPFVSWGAAVPWLLSIIMLGMGMTLRWSDFAIVARRPIPLGIGILAQFVIMPLVAYALTKVLDLNPMLAVGVILVGAAPGGTSSNVMTYLAKGDVALSVAMTTVSTLLAPLLTPVLVWGLAGEYLPVDPGGLFTSILKVVLAPVIIGVLLRWLIPGVIDKITGALPLVSVIGITGVVMAVVAGSAPTILSIALIVIVAVVLHNLFGLLLGYAVGRLCGFDARSRRTLSIEVGLQNSGLAAALATAHFNPVAAVPAAMFSVWHNISGSLLAGWWARRPVSDPDSDLGQPGARDGSPSDR